jgi:hypothetical protein
LIALAVCIGARECDRIGGDGEHPGVDSGPEREMTWGR